VPADLPETVSAALDVFARAAQEALGGDLAALVLFGSAAEGRLRPSSDVNVILVLSAFDAGKQDRLREPLRVAQAAIRLAPMFLLAEEIPAALSSFAGKFADVIRRRRVLLGADPFAGAAIPRAAQVANLRQVLLNLVLRLRQRYLLVSLREEQAAHAVADAAGPLRVCAADLLALEGRAVGTPKEALAAVAAESGGPGSGELLGRLSQAREHGALPPGAAGPTLLGLVDLARALHRRAEALR
jgi:predicted nucleotidyltransferase